MADTAEILQHHFLLGSGQAGCAAHDESATYGYLSRLHIDVPYIASASKMNDLYKYTKGYAGSIQSLSVTGSYRYTLYQVRCGNNNVPVIMHN